MPTREQAFALLKKYNQQSYHLRHALTVEQVMRYLARDQGFEEEEDFWGLVGLLHDIDFEQHPDAHCEKAPEMLQEIGADDRLVRAVCSHGWGLHPGSPTPEHQMEKVLFAADELTGLVFAATLMRPSRSVQDMAVKSLRKKFRDKSFAAGCSREVIAQGADLLGWSLDELMDKTLAAMRHAEPLVEEAMRQLEPEGS